MSTRKRKLVWPMIIIVVVIIAAVVWFWIWPTMQDVEKSVVDIQAKKAQIKKLEQQQTLKPSQEFEPYEVIARDLQNISVGENNLVSVIETIESVVAGAGLQFTLSAAEGSADKKQNSSQPDTKNPEQEIAKDSFSLKLELSQGSLVQMLHVLNKIENLPVVINTDSVVFNKGIADVNTEDANTEDVKTTLRAIYQFTIPFAK